MNQQEENVVELTRDEFRQHVWINYVLFIMSSFPVLAIGFMLNCKDADIGSIVNNNSMWECLSYKVEQARWSRINSDIHKIISNVTFTLLVALIGVLNPLVRIYLCRFRGARETVETLFDVYLLQTFGNFFLLLGCLFYSYGHLLVCCNIAHPQAIVPISAILILLKLMLMLLLLHPNSCYYEALEKASEDAIVKQA